MKTLKKIETICKSNLVDIVSGPMTLKELDNEIIRMMRHRSPEYIIVTIIVQNIKQMDVKIFVIMQSNKMKKLESRRIFNDIRI